MDVLALEPYYGGSHRAFVEGWAGGSRHHFEILGLPPRKWKWRMRGGAITLARQVAELADSRRWDLLLCSDMLNLAEFLGLAPPQVRDLPSVAYFHENQITYPVQVAKERDYHFGLTNLTTCLAARQVWFNSAFHRDTFLRALPGFLKRMPDHRPLGEVETVGAKSRVEPPGIAPLPPRRPRSPGPLRILWCARWEHDKAPETFFTAMDVLAKRGVDFRLDVVGERFSDAPQIFDQARRQLAAYIDRWGYQEARRDYEAVLLEADVAVSTAHHEFFGLAIVEAVAAGAYPLLPRRLSYPEVLAPLAAAEGEGIFYQGGARELASCLELLAQRLARGELWRADPQAGRRAVERYTWPRRIPQLDRALETVMD